MDPYLAVPDKSRKIQIPDLMDFPKIPDLIIPG
jgi:hypothetical protein